MGILGGLNLNFDLHEIHQNPRKSRLTHVNSSSVATDRCPREEARSPVQVCNFQLARASSLLYHDMA